MTIPTATSFVNPSPFRDPGSGGRGRPLISTSPGAEPFIFLESQERQVADPLNDAGVPVLVTRGPDHTREPSLEYGYHVHPVAWWVSLLGGGDGLVQSVCPLVGGVDHDGRGLLSGSVRPSLGGSSTGNLQQ